MLLRSYILLIAGLVVFFSCRTAREFPEARIRTMAPEKILKRAQQNTFDYDDLTIRRINCQFSNNDYTTNFRVNLKASKDDKILASISKINIPVGRVLLTADSVIYVNYMDRNYFLDDYTFLSKLFNINIDFLTIQTIISNNFFSYGNNSTHGVFQAFESSVEGGKYLLKSVNQQNAVHAKQNMNTCINNSNFQPLDNEKFFFKKMVFDPRNFTLEKLILDDQTNNRKLEVAFSDFVELDKKNYPSIIDMKISSPNEIIKLTIRLNGFSTEKLESINLKVPDKYEQIRVN